MENKERKEAKKKEGSEVEIGQDIQVHTMCTKCINETIIQIKNIY